MEGLIVSLSLLLTLGWCRTSLPTPATTHRATYADLERSLRFYAGALRSSRACWQRRGGEVEVSEVGVVSAVRVEA